MAEDQGLLDAPSAPSNHSNITYTSSTKKQREHSAKPSRPEPINPCWTKLTEGIIHRNIRAFNVFLAVNSARYPKRTIVLITLISFGLVITGFLTNFELIFGHSELFTPFDSRPQEHAHWIEYESDFPLTSDVVFLIHSEGENVLNQEAVRRLFYALNTIRDQKGYQEMCAQSHYLDFENKPDCWIWSPTHFWNNNVTEFEEKVHSDDDIVRTLSRSRFHDGTPVFKEAMFGKYRAVNQTFVYNAIADEIFYYPHKEDYLTYVPNYFVSIGMPYIDDTWVFQEEMLMRLAEIKDEWANQSPEENPMNIQLDFFCGYAYELEYARALTRDFPLVPVVFFVMLGFTCFIFHGYGLMQKGAPTRATIGMASVVTVGMSMMTGFGLMFILGVPFTNITLMAPFIILGVGLDDTFIITGAYFRRIKDEIQEQELKTKGSHSSTSISCQIPKSGFPPLVGSFDSDDPMVADNDLVSTASPLNQLYDHSIIVERVRSTMEEVGMSISLTTLTTTTAFVLGCLSTIPGIRWLCLYASVTIVFDSLYQVTYFVALLTLDERRVVLAQAKAQVKNSRADSEPEQERTSFTSICSGSLAWLCSLCSNSWVTDAYSRMFPREDSEEQSGPKSKEGDSNPSPIFVERFMSWYARTLLKPRVRNTVLFLCVAMFGVCLYGTTQLTQKFDPQDYVPKDSFIQGFFTSLYQYSSLVLTFEVYFRNIDQGDPAIQQQMRDYIYELSKIPQIGKLPEPCWITDMADYLAGDFSKLDGLSDDQQAEAGFLASALQTGNYTFEETLSLVMSVPAIRDVYGEDIVRNEAGEVTASRCFLHLRQLDFDNVQGQIDFLHQQQDIARAQPVNQLPENQDDWAMFAFSSFHGYWELYAVAIQELVLTTIMGVVSVCLVGFVVIPHWTAVCFVGPLIIMLYFDMLGIMYFCGIYINALTYVTIVISIGLLVDFLMHILLRYYETTGTTRDAKVRETLETMGASMTLGGFTTWLGVIPMALSTTAIFTTIFVAFLAMVTLGLVIGLAFLPALLSLCGPVVCVNTHDLGNAGGNSPSPTKGSPTSNTTTMSITPILSKTNRYQLLDDEDSEELKKDNAPAKKDAASAIAIPHTPSWASDDDDMEEATGLQLVLPPPDTDNGEHSHDEEQGSPTFNSSDPRTDAMLSENNTSQMGEAKEEIDKDVAEPIAIPHTPSWGSDRDKDDEATAPKEVFAMADSKDEQVPDEEQGSPAELDKDAAEPMAIPAPSGCSSDAEEEAAGSSPVIESPDKEDGYTQEEGEVDEPEDSEVVSTITCEMP